VTYNNGATLFFSGNEKNRIKETMLKIICIFGLVFLVMSFVEKSPQLFKMDVKLYNVWISVKSRDIDYFV
jgi:hypothetical protein